MSLALEFHPRVRSEVADAHDCYEAQRSGLGGEFLNEVQRALSQISANPGRCGFVEADIRGGPLRRFPYAVYYRVLDDRIRILAVYHASRDPAGWQSRT